MIPKRFELIRDTVDQERCFGRLWYKNEPIAETMEPGDGDTAHPRVRAGFYVCVPHGWEPNTARRYHRTYALVGDGVSHDPMPGIPRSAILLHRGVRDEHTLGCVLVGSTRGVSRGEPALLEIKPGEALEKIRTIVGCDTFYLTIREGQV